MDPQRPYAQLLLPIAKSLKLLRRAQHHRYVDKRAFAKYEAVYAIWQKLAAKNIPACPGSFVCDLFIYPGNCYLGLLVDPAPAGGELRQLLETDMLDGLLCAHTQGKLVNAVESIISLTPALFDYLSAKKLVQLATQPTPTMVQLATHSKFKKVGQAVSFIHMLARHRPTFSVTKLAPEEIAILADLLTVLDRNSNQRIRVDKLCGKGQYGHLLEYLTEVLPVRLEVSADAVYIASEW